MGNTDEIESSADDWDEVTVEKKLLQSSTKPMTCKDFYCEDFQMNNFVKNFLNFSEILSWLRRSIISSSINGRSCLFFFRNFILSCSILLRYFQELSTNNVSLIEYFCCFNRSAFGGSYLI